MQPKDRQSAKYWTNHWALMSLRCPDALIRLMSRYVHTNSYNGRCQSVSAAYTIRTLANLEFQRRWRIRKTGNWSSSTAHSTYCKLKVLGFKTVSSDKKDMHCFVFFFFYGYLFATTVLIFTSLFTIELPQHLLLLRIVYWPNFRSPEFVA